MIESKTKQRPATSVVAIQFYDESDKEDIRLYDLRMEEGRRQMTRAISWAVANNIPFDGESAATRETTKVINANI